MSFALRKANSVRLIYPFMNLRSFDLSMSTASSQVNELIVTSVFVFCRVEYVLLSLVRSDGLMWTPVYFQPAYFSPEGEERKSDSKVVRCTCSKSKRMPFCDGSHRHPWYKLSFQQNIRGVMGGQFPSAFAILSSQLYACILLNHARLDGLTPFCAQVRGAPSIARPSSSSQALRSSAALLSTSFRKLTTTIEPPLRRRCRRRRRLARTALRDHPLPTCASKSHAQGRYFSGLPQGPCGAPAAPAGGRMLLRWAPCAGPLGP
jgi:hypothetical protein